MPDQTIEKRRVSPLVKWSLWIFYVGLLAWFVDRTILALDLVPAYTPQPEVAIKLYYEDPNGLVRLRPNARYYTNGNVPVIVNRDGYRDRVYTRSRIPSVMRIAAVGDSFTMGDGVPVGDSYPKQLEALFKLEGQNVEVINFGVSATNTLQQLALLQHMVIGYKPDVVILGFSLNDYKVFTDTEFERAEKFLGVTYRVNADQTVTFVPNPRTIVERVESALHNRLAVVRLWSAARRGLSAPQPRNIGPADPDLLALVRENFTQINHAVLEMRTSVESIGGRLVIAVFPAMTELRRPYTGTFDEYPYETQHREVEDFLRGRDILDTDLLRSLRGRRLQELIVGNFDPHFNQRGNAVIAKELHDFLVTERLVGVSN